MKDIDFDELDKAVNNLMGGVKSDVDDRPPEAKTLTIAPTLKDDERPVYTKIENAAEKIGDETISSPLETTEVITPTDHPEVLAGKLGVTMFTAEPIDQSVAMPAASEPPTAPEPVVDAPAVEPTVPVARPQLVVPSRGRFMDMIHPSSDMKSTTKRTDSKIKPLQSTAQVTPLDDEVPVSASVTEDEGVPFATHVSHEAVTIAPPQSGDAPEVISNSETSETPDVSKASELTISEEAPELSEISNETMIDTVSTEEAPATSPMATPFLPDAKVEKRPLGGSSNDDMDRNEDGQIVPDLDAIPNELRDDVMAIETGGAEVAGETKTPVASSATASSAPTEVLVPPSPQASGSIFDTQEYHAQPVTHQAKKSSSWLWVLIILIVIGLCAAGGVAFYLLMSK